jgi:hypothetical protein
MTYATSGKGKVGKTCSIHIIISLYNYLGISSARCADNRVSQIRISFAEAKAKQFNLDITLGSQLKMETGLS